MTENTDFEPIFASLKTILLPYAEQLVLKLDTPGEFFINTAFIMKNKKTLYFGSVKTNKNYVSFHLMPVYVFPELLKDISPELKRRMQGKSCFNFKSVNEVLFKELAVLSHAGYQQYKNAGYA